MSSRPAPPAVPAQRKVKLITSLKATQTEQTSKLQAKIQLENDLLEDIRTYTKVRSQAEKDYAQAILKVSQQLLAKFTQKDEIKEETKTPFGLWRKILEASEAMANTRLEISQLLLSSISENIKTLRTDRVVTLKKCATLVEKQHEEMQQSATDLVKAQKDYLDLEKLALQAKENAKTFEEKLKKGAVSIFTSKARMEKNSSKANERFQASEKRATISRNEYLLSLAAMNAHQGRFYALDIPDLIAMQDGNVYEKMKEYYSLIASAEIEASEKCVKALKELQVQVNQLERAYAVQFFLKKNPVFTKCTPYEFSPLAGDKVVAITGDAGADLHLKKEARKWVLRLAREQKTIQKKTKELRLMQPASSTDPPTSTEGVSSASVDSTKSNEQNVDTLAEEIRHLEVLRTKSEARVEAMRQAGVNVDEWLQDAQDEQDDAEPSEDASEYGGDEFDDAWEEPPASVAPDFSDDALSTSSTQDIRNAANPAVVIYAFTAASQEEISIVDGEEVDILDGEGDGWLRVRNKANQVGYVPESYLERRSRLPLQNSDSVVSDPSSLASESPYAEVPMNASSRNSLNSSGNSASSDKLSDRPNDCIGYAKAIYSYEACESEELSFSEGDVIAITSKGEDDDGWWEGVFNGRRGVFPNIVVEEICSNGNSVNALQSDLSQFYNAAADPYATFPRLKDDAKRRPQSLYTEHISSSHSTSSLPPYQP